MNILARLVGNERIFLHDVLRSVESQRLQRVEATAIVWSADPMRCGNLVVPDAVGRERFDAVGERDRLIDFTNRDLFSQPVTTRHHVPLLLARSSLRFRALRDGAD